MRENLVALITGAIFGLGLCISQMTNPDKVLAFLDITGQWDPSLMLVMGGALAVSFITFRQILRRPKPVVTEEFYLPEKKSLDRQLLAGAIIFGIGWGLIGYCPGPAITALGFLKLEPIVVVVSIIIGSFVCDLLPARA